MTVHDALDWAAVAAALRVLVPDVRVLARRMLRTGVRIGIAGLSDGMVRTGTCTRARTRGSGDGPALVPVPRDEEG
ncbi:MULTISPECIES: hypothetical protein [Streptomyces]|uniref:hypothetical protein n=1 Tax=Streptomyces TaxID=1883 RepID=UPI00163C86DD|nr:MULTISPECIES: hypothetical protein [Streptomyces]MBC2876371.1 hypothetical protein [Streptomyces sp. TYQ1024]UBI35412.1 hypothetical protein K7I03_02330 [Streptomyces mobaraensis]UKW28004.1 hypothetical protein MCU78_02360 [Streptomyces sp. TYQ1024]